MGYFSNGTEGELYCEQYCYRCANWRDEGDDRGAGCAIWDAHLIYNYDHCNDADSILHMLIPRSKDGLDNEQCLMFFEGSTNGDPAEMLIAQEYIARGQKREALIHLERALGGDWNGSLS